MNGFCSGTVHGKTLYAFMIHGETSMCNGWHNVNTPLKSRTAFRRNFHTEYDHLDRCENVKSIIPKELL